MKKKFVIFIAALAVFVIAIYGYLGYNHFRYPLKYQESIQNYSSLYKVDKVLVASLINAESSFKQDAISAKGAVGLMQIMPKTAEWLCKMLGIEYNKDDLFSPDYNIQLGTYYLSYLTNKFTDLTVTLCCYNAGEGVVMSWLKNKEYSADGKTLSYIPYSQTRNYVQKIQDDIKIYQKKMA